MFHAVCLAITIRQTHYSPFPVSFHYHNSSFENHSSYWTNALKLNYFWTRTAIWAYLLFRECSSSRAQCAKQLLNENRSLFRVNTYNDNETLFWFKAMIVKLCLTMEILLRTINGASWSHNRNAYGEQSKCVRFQIRLPATNNLSAYANLMDSLRNILIVDSALRKKILKVFSFWS